VDIAIGGVRERIAPAKVAGHVAVRLPVKMAAFRARAWRRAVEYFADEPVDLSVVDEAFAREADDQVAVIVPLWAKHPARPGTIAASLGAPHSASVANLIGELRNRQPSL
jgi:hypothetical protein